ncbi:MAG: glycosyltransferase [Betaproteobacteria bacterium]|nr:glycosyltransferase [Betaproteobacteria bacterium]
MKILHVESGKHFYGGARQVAYIIKGLSESGIENILACPQKTDLAQHVSGYAEVCEIPMKGDADIGMTWRLVNIIRKYRPDMIHLHSRRGADIWGGIAAKITHTPCILSRRVDNPEPHWFVSLKYRLYDHIITISEAIRQVLISEGVPSQKITCVRSAVDPTPYLQPVDRTLMSKEFRLPENALVIGIVAQLIPRKGHHYLIDAIEILSKDYPQIRVICFGQGPLLSPLKTIVQQKKLENVIQFAGFRTDLPKWLGGLDILAHPADMEGLGVSLLQASAAAVPIVTTRAGGLPEAVQDGVTGILIDPGDAVSLTAALRRLIEDTSLRHKLGAAGRKRIMSAFSVEAMAKGNLDVYKKVLNETHTKKK